MTEVTRPHSTEAQCLSSGLTQPVAGEVGVSSPLGLSTKFWPLGFTLVPNTLHTLSPIPPHSCQIVSPQAGWPCLDRHPHALKELHAILRSPPSPTGYTPHPSHTPKSLIDTHTPGLLHTCPCNLHTCAGRCSQTHPNKACIHAGMWYTCTQHLTRMHWHSGVLCARPSTAQMCKVQYLLSASVSPNYNRELDSDCWGPFWL